MGHYLHKPNGSRLLSETLTAQIEAILADETRLVCAEATANQGPSVLTLDFKARNTYHWRDPFPYLRGRENQMAS